MTDLLIHSKFGKGKIISIYSNNNLTGIEQQAHQYIKIQFNNTTKSFIYPNELLDTKLFTSIPTTLLQQINNDLNNKNELLHQINNNKINNNKINFLKHYYYLSNQIEKLKNNNFKFTTTKIYNLINNNNYISYTLPQNIDIESTIKQIFAKLTSIQKQQLTIYFNLNSSTPTSFFAKAEELYSNLQHSKNIYQSFKNRLTTIYKHIFNIKIIKQPLNKIKNFDITEDGTLDLYTGESEIIRIPSGVKTIKNSFGFYSYDVVKTIIIPKSVTTIEENAFDVFDKLENITLTYTLYKEYKYMFENIKHIKLTGKVPQVEVGSSCFDNQSGVEKNVELYNKIAA